MLILAKLQLKRNNMKIYLLIISLIGITFFSCSKEEGEGGRSSISGIINGTEYTAPRAEVTEIICVSNLELDDGDYWIINTPTGYPDYFVWYNNEQAAFKPQFANRLEVKVDFSSFGVAGVMTSEDMAILTTTALNNISNFPYTIVRTGDLLTVTNNVIGAVPDADNGNSNVMVDTKTQGKDQISIHSGPFANEDVFIIYGDIDDIQDNSVSTNYDGTFKFNNLRKGKYKVFAYNEDESQNEPLVPVFVEVTIGGNENVDIGTITIEKKDD